MDNSLFNSEDELTDKISEISPCGRYSRLNEIIGKGASKTVYKGLNIIQLTEIAYNVISIIDKTKEDKIRINNEIKI